MKPFKKSKYKKPKRCKSWSLSWSRSWFWSWYWSGSWIKSYNGTKNF